MSFKDINNRELKVGDVVYVAANGNKYKAVWSTKHKRLIMPRILSPNVIAINEYLQNWDGLEEIMP